MAPPSVAVVMPAWNEAGSVGATLAGLAKAGFGRVVVVDGGSTDGTPSLARQAGAEVVVEARRGYGRACLAGLDHLRQGGAPEAVAFVDADGSSDPGDVARFRDAIAAGAEFVLGSRPRGRVEAGSVAMAAKIGNAAVSRFLALSTGFPYTDLGPLRMLRWAPLERLAMEDPTWGWNVEMQVKAVRAGLRIEELPVFYRRRVAGESKISGSWPIVIRAGVRILWTAVRYRSWKPA